MTGMIRCRKVFYPFGILGHQICNPSHPFKFPDASGLMKNQSDTSFMSVRMLPNSVSALASIYKPNTHPEIIVLIFLWPSLGFHLCDNYPCPDSRCKEQFSPSAFPLLSSLSWAPSHPKLSTGATLRQCCNGFTQHHANITPLWLIECPRFWIAAARRSGDIFQATPIRPMIVQEEFPLLILRHNTDGSVVPIFFICLNLHGQRVIRF